MSELCIVRVDVTCARFKLYMCCHRTPSEGVPPTQEETETRRESLPGLPDFAADEGIFGEHEFSDEETVPHTDEPAEQES